MKENGSDTNILIATARSYVEASHELAFLRSNRHYGIDHRPNTDYA